MAEFQEVARQAVRLCDAMENCRKCVLDALGNGVCRIGLMVAEDNSGEQLEHQIMRWAAEHPEPQYPSWREYQQATFPNHMRWICPLTFGVEGLCDDIDDEHSAAECTRCRNKPIPERIAKKLGIEPKKRDEPFSDDEKGCPNCKYGDKAEDEKLCMHCRRSKVSGNATWQGMLDLWKPRDRTER